MAFKVKFRTMFPALVSAVSPITLVKTGLSYVFSLDIAALRQSLDPIYLIANLTNLILSGSTSGTITVKAPAVAGSNIVTMPAATDTLVGKATTDTLTNKTIDTAGPNTLKVGGVTVSAGQFPGTATNDNATAGNVGEVVNASVSFGSAGAITSGTNANVTSISLTAGDWDVSGVVGFAPAATTSITQIVGSISTVSATLGSIGQLVVHTTPATVWGSGSQGHVPIPQVRLSLAATTTIYLVANSTFTVSTNAAFGIITARRAR